MLSKMILGVFISFSLFNLLVICQGSVQRQNHASSKTCNINNNFYAGPNKKIENLLLDVKKQLNDIRKDLNILPQNEGDDTQVLPDNKNSSEPCTFDQLAAGGGGNTPTAKNKVIKKNCAELYNIGHKTSGVFKIDPDGTGAFLVYCDQKTAGGGWTVIQKRMDGSVNFYLGWEDYKNGFGNLSSEFWLGLDKIHRLTLSDWNKVRVDLRDEDGTKVHAEYELFAVASEKNNYKLSLGSYSGTAGDALNYHNGMTFTTKDKDNDAHKENCALKHNGAWWYNGCAYSNLNGLHHIGTHASYVYDGIFWNSWKGYLKSIAKAEIKIKPVKF